MLWRYVDLYRLLDLLQTSELHLTRLDRLEDRWEGPDSPANVARRPAIAPALAAMHAYTRTHTFLNCWNICADESYAMWRLYDAAAKRVAIKTSAARLKSALRGSLMILGARVSYLDYNATHIREGNVLHPCTHKRNRFARESEYRLLSLWSPEPLELDERNVVVRSEPDTPPPSLRESVDLEVLVEAIYVSPDARSWAAGVVADAVHRYLPGRQVRQSDLLADPVD